MDRPIMHSGGAKGADTAFEQEALKAGFTVLVHSFKGHARNNPRRVEHSQEELNLADPFLLKANETLKRTFPTNNRFVDNLLRRNYYQVKDSQLVIAVSRIVDGQVFGGTAWATQMALDFGIPVYVFDMHTNSWFYQAQEPSDGPKEPISPFAGIGSRELTDVGAKVIKSLFVKE